MPTSYGQFGTPGYFGRVVPPDIINQYPGTKNIQQAGQTEGSLLYGPLSRGYEVAAAQAADPSAQAFQGPTGGAFGQPGVGAEQLGSLFSGMMGANVAGQKMGQAQQYKAAQGMEDLANTYAQNIYGTQSAANDLALAQQQQQQAQMQGVMSLINMFTSPTGMGANILGPGGFDVLGMGQSPLGGIVQGLGGLGGGGGMAGPAGAFYGAGAGPFSAIDPATGAAAGAGDWFAGTGIGAGAAGAGDATAAILPDLFSMAPMLAV